jgi:hypothetical protein
MIAANTPACSPPRGRLTLRNTHKRSSNPLKPFTANLLIQSLTLNIGVDFTASRNDDAESLQPNPAMA